MIFGDRGKKRRKFNIFPELLAKMYLKLLKKLCIDFYIELKNWCETTKCFPTVKTLSVHF